MQRTLLDLLGRQNSIDFSCASFDSASIAEISGSTTGPSPTDRGKLGTKRQSLLQLSGLSV